MPSTTDATAPEGWAPVVATPPTPYEADVFAVVSAMSDGDELLTRRLADLVREHRTKHAKGDDIGVRNYWFEVLSSWEGSTPLDELSKRFAYAMALNLRVWPADAIPDRIMWATWEAVQKAWLELLGGGGAEYQHSRYNNDRGLSMLSAGLRAMGIPGGKVDDLLSKFYK